MRPDWLPSEADIEASLHALAAPSQPPREVALSADELAAHRDTETAMAELPQELAIR